MESQKEQFLKGYELEKAAYVNYVTSLTGAGIASLVRGGVDYNQAVELVKQASEEDPKVVAYKANMLAFEKAAEYIAMLEDKVSSMEKVAEKAEQVIAADPENPLSKLASIGFTPEEIEHMTSLPDSVLEKVASANNQPMSMGSAVGVAVEKMDPLLQFLLS